MHKPVLVDEVMKFLDPKKNENFVDCTVGGGGHAKKILEMTKPDGKLLGLDWDPQAIERAKTRLSSFKKRAILVNSSYTAIKEIAEREKFQPIAGVLLDLGLSSDQLQASGRGFSFQTNEILDMRFSPDDTQTQAKDILNDWPEEKIREILWKNGDEKFARRIAAGIIEYRKTKKIETTLQLVDIIIHAVPRQKTRIHPATQTFQALRIAVNNEFNNIRIGLRDILDILEPGGKISVITFHSLEDRIVKHLFKRESVDCVCEPEMPVCQCGHKAQIKLITKKPILPGAEEISENFRSRSAKLRVAEKI